MLKLSLVFLLCIYLNMQQEELDRWIKEGVNFITGYKIKTKQDVMSMGKHDRTYQNIYK